MNAPVLVGFSNRMRRDSSTELCRPILNPAPDGAAVLRILCQGKRLDSTGYILALDQLTLDVPPSTAPGQLELEDLPTPEVTGDMRVRLPSHGRHVWSNWGAVVLSSARAGSATLSVPILNCVPEPRTVVVTGSLGPDDGTWTIRSGSGATDPVPMEPGTDGESLTEWRVPLAGVQLPGVLTLQAKCGAVNAAGQTKKRAQLVLDSIRIVHVSEKN